MKRSSLKKNINRFIDRYNQEVEIKRYNSTPDQADAPYRQRVRDYDNAVKVKCAVVERTQEDLPTQIGNSSLRRFDVCTGPDQIVQAFHPLDFDDPRRKRDPSVIISNKDKIIINGLECRIISHTRHGDDGAGPLWYVFRCEESLE
jgi:hypothetical protein